MPKLLKVTLILSAALWLMPGFAAASSPALEKYIPDAKLVGQGRLTYMVWQVYDAALFAPAGAWAADKPYALKLSYLRPLKGKKIADRSAEEMRKQGFTDEVKLATWHGQMREIFPDVDENTALTGIYTASGETVFYKNDQRIGAIKDPDFGKTFFNIWLSPKTSEPGLRAELLSQR